MDDFEVHVCNESSILRNGQKAKDSRNSMRIIRERDKSVTELTKLPFHRLFFVKKVGQHVNGRYKLFCLCCPFSVHYLVFKYCPLQHNLSFIATTSSIGHQRQS